MEANFIPPQLIINWDQTGSKLVSVSEWTMAEEGTNQVPVVCKDDKRKITVLLSISAAGCLLPPQIIYHMVKTAACHAEVTFPTGWNVTHSDNHWSTEATMLTTKLLFLTSLL